MSEIRKNWGLPQNIEKIPEDYVWSSASFYLVNGRALIPLSDARELLV